MNSISVLFVVALATVAFSHPAEEEKKIDVRVQETKKTATHVLTHPTVKCEHITPVDDGRAARDNHRACSSHCHTLGSHYSDGKCLDGVCHCKTTAVSAANNRHPTVKCLDLIPEEGVAGAENHKACGAHCLSLNEEYLKGECSEGVCQCYVRV